MQKIFEHDTEFFKAVFLGMSAAANGCGTWAVDCRSYAFSLKEDSLYAHREQLMTCSPMIKPGLR